MITVRCLNCQLVFQTDVQLAEAEVRCPGCGATHRRSAFASSTAGDSMRIDPLELKRILQPPGDPDATSHVPREPVISCPSCKVRLYVDRKKYGGKKVRCPECKNPLLIPRLTDELPG